MSFAVHTAAVCLLTFNSFQSQRKLPAKMSMNAVRVISKMAKSDVTKFCKPQKAPFTVFIEGNIGAGKTTFLNHFKKYDDVCLHTEPMDKWTNVLGINLLDLMYKEPEKWAMPFQTYATLTMLQTHTATTDKRVKLMERSLFSARNCFVECQLKNKTLHEGMYNILQEWYDYINQSVHIQADLIVYLRTTPEVVYERMKIRGRDEESTVSFEYLKELHDLHENWLIHGLKERPAPVLVLNADLDLENINSEYVRSEGSILRAQVVNS